MTKFKVLRQYENKEQSPNAQKLLDEIEHLFEIGNEARANALLKRYKSRYSNLNEYFAKLSKDIMAIIKKCPEKDIDPDRPSSEQQYCLYTKDESRLLGRHPSKEEALDQEKAVQYFKHKGNSNHLADSAMDDIYNETLFTRYEYGMGYDSPGTSNKVNPWWGTNPQKSQDYKDYNREYPNLLDKKDKSYSDMAKEPSLNDNNEYKKLDNTEQDYDKDLNNKRFYDDWMGRSNIQ